MSGTACRVGVDIGGTFTDVVALTEGGRAAVVKVASTPDDFGRSVLHGLAEARAELDLPAAGVAEIVHGFTVATNAILEGKGAAMALITTEGFRDVLEIARLRVPRLYDLAYRKPPPLVERRLRLEVRERVDARGRVLVPLDAGEVERAVAAVQEAGVSSVAVCLLHSYANPEHERRIGAALRAALPDLDVSLSCELLPEAREYERTSTTVINGYIRPVVARYLERLVAELRRAGTAAPVTVMQSNGGLMPVELAARKPMYCIESGPAAGVIGAAEIGARLGQADLISFDMGGTTAKASIVEGGQVLLAPECEVGGGMNAGHRLLRGAGYVLRVPTIDIAEVSAGGGSIAWADRAGGLQIGPRSAGAVPGPVCYGAGGTEPTVSDADVALGFLNPEHLLGGSFPIDAGRARAALRERLAAPAGLTETEAAWGVHTLANVKMGGALRAVSSERGRDPRRFAMIAFGGSGPVHAAGLAASLGIGHVIVPPSPGVFSAFGLLFAEVEHHFVQTLNQPLAALDLERANAILERIGDECRALLAREGFTGARQRLQTQIDARYEGQTSELTVDLPVDRFNTAALPEIASAFTREHRRSYGYSVEEPVQVASLRVIGHGVADRGRPEAASGPGDVPRTTRPAHPSADPCHGDTSRTAGAACPPPAPGPGSDSAATVSACPPADRRVYFGPRHGWITTPVVGRSALGADADAGPLIVEEYDSTTVVPPGWRAAAAGHGCMALEAE